MAKFMTKIYGARELMALFNLSSWCFVMVERLFLAVPRVCLQFVIVVFPDHTHLLFSYTGVFVEAYMLRMTHLHIVCSMFCFLSLGFY